MEPNSDFFSKIKTRNIIRPQQCRSLEVLHHPPHHRCLAKADIAHFVLTQSTCFPKLSLPGILPNSRSPKIRSTARPPWARIRSSLVASSLCVVCCQCEALSGADRPGAGSAHPSGINASGRMQTHVPSSLLRDRTQTDCSKCPPGSQ